jgi:hypothetical protein
MDPFPDFGLFELLVASGAAALARRIYVRQWAGFLFLLLSLIAPVALIFIARGELARWTAAICLATALVNAGLILSLMRDGRLSGSNR